MRPAYSQRLTGIRRNEMAGTGAGKSDCLLRRAHKVGSSRLLNRRARQPTAVCGRRRFFTGWATRRMDGRGERVRQL